MYISVFLYRLSLSFADRDKYRAQFIALAPQVNQLLRLNDAAFREQPNQYAVSSSSLRLSPVFAIN
jgi:hypothetical protein